MLIPEGSIQIIQCPCVDSENLSDMILIRHSTKKKYFITLSLSYFTLWFCDPIFPIVQHPRDKSTLEIFGYNKDLIWNSKGNMICILTEKSWVFLFQIMDGDTKNMPLFLKSINDFRNIFFEQICLFHISSYITCIISRRDFILLSSIDGNLEYVRWPDHSNGYIERKTLKISTVKFSYKYDSMSKGQLLPKDIYITQMASTRWTSIACVLSDGQAGLLKLVINKTNIEGSLVLIKDCTFSTNLCVNYIHQLIVIGDKNGNLRGYSLEKPSYEIVQTIKYSIDESRYIEHQEKSGPINLLEWSPDFTSLVVSWQEKGIAIWSIYGYLISFINYRNEDIKILPKALSMEWGELGYYLMLLTSNNNLSKNETKDSPSNKTTLLKVEFLKLNEYSKEYMTLNGRYTILISSADEVKRFFSKNEITWKDRIHIFPYTLQGDWFRLSLNKNLIDFIKVITCVALNDINSNIAVSGTTGLLLFYWKKQDWFIYQNQNNKEIYSSLTWWNKLLVMIVSRTVNPDTSKSRPEFIRFQFITDTFDDKHSVCHIPSEDFISFDIHDDILVVLHNNAKLSFFKLTLISETYSLNIKLISILNFNHNITHEATFRKFKVCKMTNLSANVDDSENKAEETASIAIFLLDGGKLYLSSGTNIFSLKDSQFPIQSTHIASYVENFWICSEPEATTQPSSLNDILWVYCGSLGLKIWLPMSYFDNEIKIGQSFLGKRNMISLPTKAYPLVIDRKNMISVGVASQLDEDFCMSNYTFGSYSIYFATQLILPELMLELIRKNLGMCALSIGQKFSENESYFVHVLEVMLHQVLEEEARSSAPIPDPILPSVISLINNFKCSLKIFSHCMRKTELLLWPHLFSLIGRPVDLFYKCLDKNQIDVAASYLIIVQNFESLKVSKQLALKLLKFALKEKLWNIVEDLVRFIRTINEEKASDVISSKNLDRSSSFSKNDDLACLDDIQEGSIDSNKSSPVKKCMRNSTSSIANEFDDNKYLDDFLFENALSIFKEYKLMDLGYFIHSTSFKFNTFLKSDITHQIAEDVNWVKQFSSLLQEFKFTANYSIFFVEEKNSNTNYEVEQQETHRMTELAQLKYLLSEFSAEKYHHYVVLLSLFLLDQTTAQNCINSLKVSGTDSNKKYCATILNGLDTLVSSNLIGIGTPIWKQLLNIRVSASSEHDGSLPTLDLDQSRVTDISRHKTPNTARPNEAEISQITTLSSSPTNETVTNENKASCSIS